MLFMYQYPETSGTEGDLLDAGPVAEVAVAAEAAGWGGLSFTEHPAPSAKWLEHGGHQSLDPFVALACAAGATSRVRLLTYLSVAPYRNPLLLAKTAASLDKVSNGRFILGIGTGYLKSEFFALGVDFENRNRRFDEALDVLPLHWKGDPFSYEGSDFDARGIIGRPRPVQDPIPIWIGGNSRLSRRRVAERADGWMPMLGPATLSTTARTPGMATVADVGRAVDELRELRADAGRADEPLDVLFSYQDPTIDEPEREADRHLEAFAELDAVGITAVVFGGRTKSLGATQDFLAAFGATYLADRYLQG
jgi:probable F420-dependent oxidoreductase